MAEREINRVFRDAAYLAGDIVFCYDMITGKFMHYSDKSELSRYGSWLTNFDQVICQAGMIHPEDMDSFTDIVTRMKAGASGTMEGTIRIRFSARGEYHYYHILARTNYDKGVPVEVIGRAVDIQAFVTANEARLKENAHAYQDGGVKDKDDFIDYIIRYSRSHKTKDFLTCAIFRIPNYDEIIDNMTPEETREYMVNLTRRIRRCFPHDAVVARIGAHRLGVFSGEVPGHVEAGQLIARATQEIKESGTPYGVKLDIWTGVCAEPNLNNNDGLSIYDKAQAALDKAKTYPEEKVVFYAPDRRKKHTTVDNDVQETDDMVVEYALRLLGEGDEINGDVKMKIGSIITALMERVGHKYGVDRVAISLCRTTEYEEYLHWENEQIAHLPEGMLLHVNGNERDIESKVNLWEPYILNNVDSYPDDSIYGQTIRFSAVKSVLQNGFECSNGYRCIVSLEYYNQVHYWTEDDIRILDRMKYIAEFCIKYVR